MKSSGTSRSSSMIPRSIVVLQYIIIILNLSHIVVDCYVLCEHPFGNIYIIMCSRFTR